MSGRQCDVCGEGPGWVQTYQTRGSEYDELWLCARCAEALGVTPGDPTYGPTVRELLSGLIATQAATSCSCGTSFRQIRERGAVGCPDCYHTYRSQIYELLTHSCGAHSGGEPQIVHRGRLPRRIEVYRGLLIDREARLEELRDAVDHEDYERAARIRDRLTDPGER